VVIKASVREHINAIEEMPEWVVSLGEMIHRLDGCSTAIAAARARDLYRSGEIGKAIENIMRGWQTLREIDFSKLSPMQRETIEIIVMNILEEIECKNQVTDKGGKGS
jgi:hypothetical protein